MKKILFFLFWLPICSIFAQNTAKMADLPVAICQPNMQVGVADLAATELNNGSFDPQNQPIFFKIRRKLDINTDFLDKLTFDCAETGVSIDVILRVFNVPIGAGAVADSAFLTHFSDCETSVSVADLVAPICVAPPSFSIFCEKIDSVDVQWTGALTYSDNCGIQKIDTILSFLPSKQVFFDEKYGQITRTFVVKDYSGNSATASQTMTVNYRTQFRLHFPDDITSSTVCNTNTLSTLFAEKPTILNENCADLSIDIELKTFFVVPDACYKVHQIFTIKDLKTFNSALGEVSIPNTANTLVGSKIWVGADANNQPAWAIADPNTPDLPTILPYFSIFPAPLTGNNGTQIGTPAYVYIRPIKILDMTPPQAWTPKYEFCDSTANDPNAWNQDMPCNTYGISNTWDPVTQSHDLREEIVDISIAGLDECSGTDLSFRFLLFLDLNGDGVMETTINSEIPAFGFGLREDEIIGGKRIAHVTRDEDWDNCDPLFNHQKISNFTLPNGTHKIKWVVEDRCGNDFPKEYDIHVGECQSPKIECRNLLKINQLYKWSLAGDPSATRPATEFLKSASDNITPFSQLQFALRDPAINPGMGFPTNGKTLTWHCGDLGFRPLELWVRDQAGNTNMCFTAMNLKDGTHICPMDSLKNEPIEYRNSGASEAFKLFQNQPNPFFETTEISFYLPKKSAVKIDVFDQLGRLIFSEKRDFEAGNQTWNLDFSDRNARGLFFVKLTTGDFMIGTRILRI